MVTLWFTKIKLGMDELASVPPHHYDNVKARLVEAGLYDDAGNKIEQVTE